MFVSILRQGDFLIASIHTALDDKELLRFQKDLVDQIGSSRACGVVIDIAALDVLDSFASLSLRNLAQMAQLRGASTVIVGIQPEVAFAVVQLRMELDVYTALDLEEGLTYLEQVTSGNRAGSPTLAALRRRRLTAASSRPLPRRLTHWHRDDFAAAGWARACRRRSGQTKLSGTFWAICFVYFGPMGRPNAAAKLGALAAPRSRFRLSMSLWRPARL